MTYVHMPEEDGATAMDNMQERFGEDRTCITSICSRTDTQTRSTQYSSLRAELSVMERTENARLENAGRSKMHGLNTRDCETRHQTAGLENALKGMYGKPCSI